MLRRGSIHQWPTHPFICDPHADHHPSKSFQLTPACVTGPNPLLYPFHHLLLFKLSTLQDLSSKMCFPPPSSSACKFGIFRIVLKISPLLSYVGLDLCLALVSSFIGCCRRMRFFLLGGSFASVRLYCLLLLSCLFLVSTGWEC